GRHPPRRGAGDGPARGPALQPAGPGRGVRGGRRCVPVPVGGIDRAGGPHGWPGVGRGRGPPAGRRGGGPVGRGRHRQAAAGRRRGARAGARAGGRRRRRRGARQRPRPGQRGRGGRRRLRRPLSGAVPTGARPMPVPYDQLGLPEVVPYAPPTEIVERAGGSWLARSRRTPVVVGHEAARDLLKDRRLHHLLRHMADVRGSDDPALERRPGSILSAEGEEHLRLRRLCLPAFKQRSVDELRPYMAGLVRQHVASFAADGEVELVGRLCEPYPVQVIAHVLGAPEDDWPLFARWATDLLMIFSTDLERDLPVVKASQAEMTAYVEELIERRRREPGDDLLTKLIEAEEDGDRLSTEELVTLVEAILTGGSDTTRNQLGATVYLLLRHGRWGEVVDDPGLVPMAVEEALRLS